MQEKGVPISTFLLSVPSLPQIMSSKESPGSLQGLLTRDKLTPLAWGEVRVLGGLGS